jgi:hypothetical protein
VLVREHKGVAAANGAGQHQVDWVQAQRQRHLGKDDFLLLIHLFTACRPEAQTTFSTF